MARRLDDEAPSEADRFLEAPHPRETYGLIGHGVVETELLEAYRLGRLPHALLIGGQAGIGKATLAWRLARFVLAHPDPAGPQVFAARDLSVSPQHSVARQIEALSHSDLFLLRREWNEKSKKPYTEIRADDVRRAIQMFQRAAGAGGYRVCVLDSADDLNRSGANALLKLIEEPPPRSLFLLVAHRPGQVLATIRSRCRYVPLEPLSVEDLLRVVDSLGLPWTDAPASERRRIAETAHGSVHDALRRLGGQMSEFDTRLRNLLANLPDVDWRGVHLIADQVSGRDRATEFETMMNVVFDWLDDHLQDGLRAGQGVGRLAPLAEVWEKVADAARESEALNLDRRQLVLGVFADLATVARSSAS